jgi:hypothetical protein
MHSVLVPFSTLNCLGQQERRCVDLQPPQLGARAGSGPGQDPAQRGSVGRGGKGGAWLSVGDFEGVGVVMLYPPC